MLFFNDSIVFIASALFTSNNSGVSFSPDTSVLAFSVFFRRFSLFLASYSIPYKVFIMISFVFGLVSYLILFFRSSIALLASAFFTSNNSGLSFSSDTSVLVFSEFVLSFSFDWLLVPVFSGSVAGVAVLNSLNAFSASALEGFGSLIWSSITVFEVGIEVSFSSINGESLGVEPFLV